MKNLKHQIFRTLFIDIETVSSKPTFKMLPSSMQNLWKHKARIISKLSSNKLTSEKIESLYREKAAIYSEFGKIICISIGRFEREKNQIVFKKRTFSNPIEEKMLKEFHAFIAKYFNDPNRTLICGHNIREFDIPYICRRSLINNVKLPLIFKISGKKPWETKYIKDTLQLWKFGDYKYFTSLGLMCEIFGIDSPKNNLHGSKVGYTYWIKDDLDKIISYCEQDIEAVAKLYCKILGEFDFADNESDAVIQTINIERA